MENKEPQGLSRREFLKNAGIVIGGAALASLAMSSACGNAKTSSAPTTPGTTAPTTPATSTNPVTITSTTSTTPVTTSAPPSTPVVTTSTTTTSGTTKPVTTTKSTTPPPSSLNSNLIDIPGCDTKVALDRTYSTDHVWVKTLNNNTVQIGMSDPFQILADRVKTLYLSPPGTKLTVQAAFGYIEADKLSVDLISPVSGTILTTNTPLMAIPGPINSDPYGTGWMLTIQLTAPAELQNLVAPRYYAYLESGKNWTGPVPPMH